MMAHVAAGRGAASHGRSRSAAPGGPLPAAAPRGPLQVGRSRRAAPGRPSTRDQLPGMVTPGTLTGTGCHEGSPMASATGMRTAVPPVGSGIAAARRWRRATRSARRAGSRPATTRGPNSTPGMPSTGARRTAAGRPHHEQGRLPGRRARWLPGEAIDVPSRRERSRAIAGLAQRRGTCCSLPGTMTSRRCCSRWCHRGLLGGDPGDGRSAVAAGMPGGAPGVGRRVPRR